MHTCPVCQHTEVSLVFNLQNPIFECGNCRFQFCPDASFNTSFTSDLDEASRLKALKALRIENFNRILAAVLKVVTPSAKGLEVGVGHGWFLEACKMQGLTCEGIEPETHFNDQYRAAGLSVRNGFYPEAVEPGSSYDFIAFNDVFEHLPDVDATMKVNYELLQPKGVLSINLPIQEGLTYAVSKLAYRFGVKSLLNRMWQFNFHSPHLSYFTKSTIQSLAVKHGFELVESFPLKTVNLSEVKDRINQDKSSNPLFRFVSIVGVYVLYPFLQRFPDTYCFVFKKKR